MSTINTIGKQVLVLTVNNEKGNISAIQNVYTKKAFLQALDITEKQLVFLYNHGYLKVAGQELLIENILNDFDGSNWIVFKTLQNKVIELD